MKVEGSDPALGDPGEGDCAPVLLVGFNRPDHFRRVLEKVAKAQPPRLYVAVDGPRTTHPEDEEKVLAVRQTVQDADLAGIDVHTWFREHNVGCRRGVSGAIDWFFEQEPEGIILEDDCLPLPGFFEYCTQLLERWRDEERVFTISGDGILGGYEGMDASYGFSTVPFIWGWASWRRAWKHYHSALGRWGRLRDTDWIRGPSQGYRDHERYWRRAFDGEADGSIDSWAYQWTLAHWLHGGLCAVPAEKRVLNIGFGDDATHTIGTDSPSWMAAPPSKASVLRHPDSAELNPAADRFIMRAHFGTMFHPLGPVSLKRTVRRVLAKARRVAARGRRQAKPAIRRITPPIVLDLIRPGRVLAPRQQSLGGLADQLAEILPEGPGYYVELGANDGLRQSNTFWLERERGWRGVLVEPAMNRFFELLENRSDSNAFFCAACVPEGYEQEWVGLVYGDLMSATEMLESDLPSRSGHIEASRRHLSGAQRPIRFAAEARTLQSLLDEAGAPGIVDFLSLDVEGAELDVLRGVDHLRQRFRWLLIECRDPDRIAPAMTDWGYALRGNLSVHDLLFEDVRGQDLQPAAPDPEGEPGP